MISAAFCFATMGALAHTAGGRCDWQVVAFLRILATFALSAGSAWAAGVRLVVWKPRTLWMRSIAGTISLVCSFYALTHLPIADALTITNTYPLWIVLASGRAETERRGAADLVCVVCAVIGVGAIQAPYLSGTGDAQAVVVALAASFAAAVAMTGLHRLREVDARAVVAHFSGLASLTLGAWLVAARPNLATTTFDAEVVAMLAGVGLCGTFGQVLMTKAYASGPPARVSVLSLTQVVFGLGYDLILQTRQLTFTTLLGFVMVLAPTAWITVRAARRPELDRPAREDGLRERSLAS